MNNDQQVLLEATRDFVNGKAKQLAANDLVVLEAVKRFVEAKIKQIELSPVNVSVDQRPVANAMLEGLALIASELGKDRVIVNCDMTPLAEVLGTFVEEMREQREMMSQLLQIMSEREPITFSPVIQAAEMPDIELSPIIQAAPAPEAKVIIREAPAPAPAPRVKRKFRITHDDGTKSTVVEE